MTPQTYLTAAFYKFVALPQFAEMQEPLQVLCAQHHIKGLILLASEGINSTISGAPDDVYAVLAVLRKNPLLHDLVHKESWSSLVPFHRMKVRLKKEIVTLGVEGISPTTQAGTYVKPHDWNALIRDPDVIVIDTRNTYEVDIGTFKGAINPQIKTFGELADWVNHNPDLQNPSAKQKKIAMFCTGGIRCEKSTALLRSKGFDAVYHLQGGILKYLEEIPLSESLWQGACFVFDERVSVGHGLQPGPHQLCRCCRQPLPDGALLSPQYERGVSCPRCFETSTPAQKNGARERQRQWDLAQARQQALRGDEASM